MTKPLLPLLLSLLPLWLAVSAAAEPGMLRVGTSGDYAPFSVADPATAPELGEPTGFDPDVARAYAASRGLRIEWVRFRWPELLSDLKSGAFDVAMSGVTVRPDRSIAGTFSVPIATSGAMLLVTPELAGRTLSELDDPMLSIAVNAGGHLERVARRRFTRARLRPIPDNAGVLRALVAGQVEVAVTDTQEVSHWRARHPELHAVGPFSRDRKAYLAGPDAAHLLADLDAWLLEREARGELAELRDRHLGSSGPDTRPAAPLEALLASMDERLALMPLVAEVKRARGLAIADPDREEEVIETAVAGVARAASTTASGIAPTPDAVRMFFRAQIEAAKQIQQNVLDRPATSSDEPLPDLAAEIRPALIRIGDRIALLLTRLPPDTSPKRVEAATRRALAGRGLSEPRLDNLAAAIAAVALPPAATRPQ